MKKRSYLSTDLVNYLKKMATEYSNPKYVIKYSCLKSRSLKTALVRDFSNIQYRASPNPTESKETLPKVNEFAWKGCPLITFIP